MELSAYQAGQFEAQLEYRSFLPEPINHGWTISDPQVLQLLGQADRALGELNAFAQLIPDIEFFIRMYVAKEATQSSRIEGTQTNIEDAFKDAEDLLPEVRDDWSEVQNYIRAITFAIDSLERLPLSNRLLRDTHAILLDGVRGETKRTGEFRITQNWIGVSLKNAVFVPPHPVPVPDLMSAIERFAGDDASMEAFGIDYTARQMQDLIAQGVRHFHFYTLNQAGPTTALLNRLADRLGDRSASEHPTVNIEYREYMAYPDSMLTGLFKKYGIDANKPHSIVFNHALRRYEITQ